MYDNHEAKMVDAGVAKFLASPVWMNNKGEVVSYEKDAYGCKVKCKLTRPDMVICMDEVDCNTRQLNNGHVGGTRYVIGKNKEARLIAIKKDKHSTCLGLILLNGDPLMCVVIVEGKTRQLLVESGVDWQADDEVVEGENKFEHYINNMGANKKHPCGPICTYQGTESLRKVEE
jgi:hypothetical protein